MLPAWIATHESGIGVYLFLTFSCLRMIFGALYIMPSPKIICILWCIFVYRKCFMSGGGLCISTYFIWRLLPRYCFQHCAQVEPPVTSKSGALKILSLQLMHELIKMLVILDPKS